MTYWHESPEIPKDSQYWLDVCWSLGISIGLHCDPSGSQMSLRLKWLWKRMWWCLYTRSRLLALNLRRPIRFKKSTRDHETEVPMVELDEFDIHYYPSDTLTALSDCLFLRDVEIQRHSALNFIKKSRLSLLISEVVMFRDYMHNQHQQQLTFSDFTSAPSPSSAVLEDCKEYTDSAWKGQSQKMLEVLQNLSTTIHTTAYRPEEPSSGTSSQQKDKLRYLQCTWNQLELLTSISTIHRQLIMTSSAPKGSAAESTSSAAQNTQVVIEIANIIQDLHQRNLILYLPGTAIALLVPVLINLLSNMRSASCPTRTAAFQKFYQCMRVLDTLGETYFFAQTVRGFFEDALGYCGGERSISGAAAIPACVRDLFTQDEVESLIIVSEGDMTRTD